MSIAGTSPKPPDMSMEKRVLSRSLYKRANSLETTHNFAKRMIESSSTTPNDEDCCPISVMKVDYILRLSQETHKSKVYEIDMSSHSVKKIENVEGFNHLRILDLSCNQIETIDGLAKNGELRELRLYANKIKRIENLEQVKKLSVLKLQQNLIENIGEQSFIHLRALTTLRLDNNCIRQLKTNELIPLQMSLRYLNISGNKLTDVSAVTCLHKLEYLDISYNNIPVLPHLKKLTQLQELVASHNRLDNLSCLAENGQLRILDISFNAFKQLRSLGFQIPKKCLETLSVQANILESIEDFPIVAPNLEILDISKNRICNALMTLAALQRLESLVELKCSEIPVFEHVSPSDLHKSVQKLELINGINFAKRAILFTGDPISVRPQTPMLSARTTSRLGLTDRETSGSNQVVLRPKTATTGLTIRQLDTIFNNIYGTMDSLEQSFFTAYEKVVTTLDRDAPQCNHEMEEELKCKSCRKDSLADESSRPGTGLTDSAYASSSQNTGRHSRTSSPSQSSTSSGSVTTESLINKMSKNAFTRRLVHAKNYSQHNFLHKNLKSSKTMESGKRGSTLPRQNAGRGTIVHS